MRRRIFRRKRRSLGFVCVAVCLTLSAALSAGATDLHWERVPPAYPVPVYVEQLLEVARGELGYTEGRDGTTRYGEWAGDPRAEWCAEFLCWCVWQVDQQTGSGLLDSVFPNYSASNTGRDWFLKKGRYLARNGNVPGWGSQWWTADASPVERNSYVPQPGDWVFFTYDGSNDTDHAALVEGCERAQDGSVRVWVIEGNNPDRVQRRDYPAADRRILGYGTVRPLADLMLRPGNEGEKVRQLQEKLIALRLLPRGGETGSYDRATADAVKAFQERSGRPATGVANRGTQLDLEKAYSTWLKQSPEGWAVDGSR